jgi:hypothetical protein
MSLEQNLREMERGREAYWLRYPATSPVKLRWRALAVRHSFHVLPGESILDLGAGSGLWTRHLAAVLRGEALITAAVFNRDLWETAAREPLPNTSFVHVTDIGRDLPASSKPTSGTRRSCSRGRCAPSDAASGIPPARSGCESTS